MTIELIPATREQVPILRRLMQLYLYDIASLDHWDIAADGYYGNPARIETFWVDGDYDRFLIMVDGVLAGFVLTSHAAADAGGEIHVISEFFVLRRYRRAGVGRFVATRLFEGFEGAWEVSVMKGNMPAREFWTSVIGGQAGSQEMDEDVVFRFSTAKR